MTTYYWTIAGVALFSFLADLFSLKTNPDGSPLRKKPLGTKICLFLTAAVLIFVAGCRYYVGTDFGAYYRGLRIYAPRLKEAVQHYDEPGLPLLATIVKWFTNDGAYLIFTCSLVTIGLFLLTIYKNTDQYLMCSMMFLFLIWDGTFNGVRQYLASAVLFCGHRFIFEKKPWKWFLTVFLAGCFHISAVVLAVLYFLLRNKVNVKNIILLTLGTYLVSANYDQLFSLIGLLKNETMVMNTYATRSVNVLRIMVSSSPAIVSLILYLGKEKTEEQTFAVNALVIHAAAMLAASNSAYLARIGIYTSPFVVLYLPKLLRLENKYVETLIRVGVLILYAICWVVDISGSESMNNFRFVFGH